MKKLLLGMVFLGGVGCMNIQPVGPLAKSMGSPKPKPKALDPNEPIVVAAPKPVPPASLVSPGDCRGPAPDAGISGRTAGSAGTRMSAAPARARPGSLR